MRSIKIFLDGNAVGHVANPNLPATARFSGWPLQEVTDIPDDVPNAEVLRRWNGTANVSWLADKDYSKSPVDRGRHSLRFDELGIGRIIKS